MTVAWIKMRTDLPTDPRILRLADILNIPESAVIGACYMLWSLVDAHTTDGRLHGVSTARLNKIVGVPKFAEALTEVGWLEPMSDGISVPRFDQHNGETAKNRVQKAERQARWRDKRVDASVDAPPSTGALPTDRQRDRYLSVQKPESEQESLPACLSRIGVGEPARSTLLACPELTTAEVLTAWKGCNGSQRLTNPVGALVSALVKAHGLAIPKNGHSHKLKPEDALANHAFRKLRESRR